MMQGQQSLADFLPGWVSTARKTGYNDDALIPQLKIALHNPILVRMSFTPSTDVPKTIDGYLLLVRQTDAILSQLDTNYIRVTALNAPALTTTNGGDAMDLSVIWTAADSANGRRPRNAAERESRRKYNQIHGLCQWCSSKDHAASTCSTAPLNKGKSSVQVSQGSGKV
ncbi:hypothetical protein K3495_g12796 [Podosphaera aphanis]|nr:hypothetical protein K3495_g12796 [Podosphaera aphanis]